MLFGYPVDPNFDLGKGQRRTLLGWVLIGGVIFSVVVSFFSGLFFATEVFQSCVATILCYGANFYVDRRQSLRERWLWHAILATTPLHIAYLAALFWSDKAFPSVMTKAVVFVPIVAIAFGIESVLIDRIVDYFTPSKRPAESQVLLRNGIIRYWEMWVSHMSISGTSQDLAFSVTNLFIRFIIVTK
jgi:hypothetical protein